MRVAELVYSSNSVFSLRSDGLPVARPPFQMVVERGSHAAILARKMEVEHGVNLSGGSGDPYSNAG